MSIDVLYDCKDSTANTHIAAQVEMQPTESPQGELFPL